MKQNVPTFQLKKKQMRKIDKMNSEKHWPRRQSSCVPHFPVQSGGAAQASCQRLTPLLLPLETHISVPSPPRCFHQERRSESYSQPLGWPESSLLKQTCKISEPVTQMLPLFRECPQDRLAVIFSHPQLPTPAPQVGKYLSIPDRAGWLP